MRPSLNTGDAMRRMLPILLLLMTLAIACKKETVPPPLVDVDLLVAPVAVIPVPPKREPVVLIEADIAPFIAHFPAINAITERYNQEIDQQEKKRGALKSAGDAEIRRYLKDKELDPQKFMRTAAKILRAWIGLRLLRDPAVRAKVLAPAARLPDELERMAAQTQARNGLKERSELYLRSLSGEERALIEKHYEELSTVLKDIPVE